MSRLPETYRLLAGTFGVLLVAFVVGMTALGLPPQDGLVFYAAGDLAQEESWDEIYPGIGAEGPTFGSGFREAYCGRLDSRHGPCEGVILPFVSPPIAIPWLWAWATLPFGAAVALVRGIGAACLILAAWWATSSAVLRSPALATPVGVALLVSLPAAMSPVELGQNTPWLLAAAALAVVAARSESPTLDVAAGAVLAACAIFKGSPGFLVALWLWPVRPWALGSFGAVMATSLALTAALTPQSIWATYAGMSTAFAGWVVDFRGNCTVEAALSAVGAPFVAAVWPLKALAVAGGSLLAARAGVGPAGRAALGWGAWLALVPLVWGHYLWVLWILVVGLLLGESTGPRRWALLGWAFGLTPILVLTTGAGSLGQVLTALWLLAGVAALFAAAIREGPGFAVDQPPNSSVAAEPQA